MDEGKCVFPHRLMDSHKAGRTSSRFSGLSIYVILFFTEEFLRTYVT